MCRFLIVKSKNKINPKELLKSFALACQKSVAPDGELQKDGYGIAWYDSKIWQLKKSLAPIWEEQDSFERIPETNILIAHARGAGFDKDRGCIDFNEPFIEGKLCFVFNGIIRGVSIKRKLEGKIGSQKLFSLIKAEFKDKNSDDVLKFVNKIILSNSEKIEGMNIGLVKDGEISALCQYYDNKDYYSLQYYQNKNLTIVSSEAFGGFDWKQFKKGEVKTF